jgi:hypothetical protein
MLAFAEHHLVLVFGLLVAFSILTSVMRGFLGLLFGKPARQHGRVVVDYVLKHGYELLNPVLAQKLDTSVLDMIKDPSLRDLARATSDITDIGRFDDGSDDWLAFRCELGVRPVTIFNFSQTPPLHGSSGPIPFRVAKIQVDGLPRFSLEPRSAATAVETVVGKLLHQPESTIELDAGQHASFGSRYWLRGADRTAVVEFFTPDRIRFLEAEHLPGTFASNARYLVYYESTAMRTEADYDAFTTVVERIAKRFL